MLVFGSIISCKVLENWTIEMPIHHFHFISMQKMMSLLEGDLEVFQSDM